MSASMMPTRLPAFASATARFTATVVLPTPPLPAPTAMMFFTPGSGARAPSPTPLERTLAVMLTSTALTPGIAITTALAWSRIWSFTGHAGVVNSIVNETVPALTLRSLTKPRLTMSRWRSGSSTALSAASTFSFSTRVGSATMTLRVSHAEERLRPFVEQHPKRVNAERGAERQQHQVDRSGKNGQQPGFGTVSPQRDTNEHVTDAPENGDEGKRDECRGRQSGGDIPVAGRGGKRRGADAERERRQADCGNQRAPHDEEDRDEVDVRRLSTLIERCHTSDGWMAMRTLTRTEPVCADVTRKRKVAPSDTPGGTATFTVWRKSASPEPAQRRHGRSEEHTPELQSRFG